MKVVVSPKVIVEAKGEQEIIGTSCDLANYMLCWPD